MIRSILRKLQPVLRSSIDWYYSKPRLIRKKGIELMLYPSVFHPTLYHSTDVLLNYVLSQNLIAGHRVLELGCGNGYISLYLAKNTQAQIFASDINPKAVQGIQENAHRNKVNISSYQSDLFISIPPVIFDYILVNPPYYPKSPLNVKEQAFFAGAKYEYFIRFFEQLPKYTTEESQIYFVLSDNAYVDPIRSIAVDAGYTMNNVYDKVVVNERFIVFQIAPNA